MTQEWLLDVLECPGKTREDKESALDRVGRNRPDPEQWHVNWSDTVKFKEHLWQNPHPPIDGFPRVFTRCIRSVHQRPEEEQENRERQTRGVYAASPSTGQLGNAVAGEQGQKAQLRQIPLRPSDSQQPKGSGGTEKLRKPLQRQLNFIEYKTATHQDLGWGRGTRALFWHGKLDKNLENEN